MTVRTDVRLPDDLHAIVVAAAQERRVSMNQLIVEGLRQAYGVALEGRADVPAAEPAAGRQGFADGSPGGEGSDGKPSRASNACPMQVPKGTKCKSCGKVH